MDMLSTVEYQLLALIGSREQSGREIAKSFEKEAGVTLSYGTLYSTLGRLRENKLITARDDEDDDGRKRYFSITANGIRSLQATRMNYANLLNFATS